jgi:hypothetical protein
MTSLVLTALIAGAAGAGVASMLLASPAASEKALPASLANERWEAGARVGNRGDRGKGTCRGGWGRSEGRECRVLDRR